MVYCTYRSPVDADQREIVVRKDEKALTVLHTLGLRVWIPEFEISNISADTGAVPFERTIMPRNPLAPPPRSAAFLHIVHKAALVNLISTPEYPNNAVYCDTSEPLTSVRIRRRSEGVSCDNVVMEGMREMNSGIRLVIGENQDEKIPVKFTCPYFIRSEDA
jgi:hypothetical protein